MPKLYTYTLLKQDGTTEKRVAVPKQTLQQLYTALNCRTIEIIPSDYYKGKKWGRCVVYGDEEARFDNRNTRNPHFDVLAPGYDIVGDCLKEEVAK